MFANTILPMTSTTNKMFKEGKHDTNNKSRHQRTATCTHKTQTHTHTNKKKSYCGDNGRCLTMRRTLWLYRVFRVCESSMSRLIPNRCRRNAKCLSGDFQCWSQDLRRGTACSRCDASSQRLKEGQTHRHSSSCSLCSPFHSVLLQAGSVLRPGDPSSFAGFQYVIESFASHIQDAVSGKQYSQQDQFRLNLHQAFVLLLVLNENHRLRNDKGR